MLRLYNNYNSEWYGLYNSYNSECYGLYNSYNSECYTEWLVYITVITVSVILNGWCI